VTIGKFAFGVEQHGKMPQLKKGIEGGFTAQPQETAFEVHNLQK
jgi:hypothetical protein